MQRFNQSNAVNNAGQIASDRQNVVVGRSMKHSMKSSKLWTGLTSLRASISAMSSGAISMSVRAQAQAMCRLACRMTAWLAGPRASFTYASHAYANAARGTGRSGSHGLAGAGHQRLPRWVTAPDIG